MTPTKPPKGLYCPNCLGKKLKVFTTRGPCSGVRVRYRGCVGCGTKLKTREVVVASRTPTGLTPDPKGV